MNKVVFCTDKRDWFKIAAERKVREKCKSYYLEVLRLCLGLGLMKSDGI